MVVAVHLTVMAAFSFVYCRFVWKDTVTRALWMTAWSIAVLSALNAWLGWPPMGVTG